MADRFKIEGAKRCNVYGWNPPFPQWILLVVKNYSKKNHASVKDYLRSDSICKNELS